MRIQHGSRSYSLLITLVTMSTEGAFHHKQYSNINEFKESMSIEFPNIDFDSVVKLYNNWLNKLNEYVSSGNQYKEEWNYVTVYAGIVGDEVLISMDSGIIQSKIFEKANMLKNLSDGLIAKIASYGWIVKSNVNPVRVDYYSKNENGGSFFDIYVYKDMLILMNGDKARPTIITGKYFLYNAGEKPQ